MQTLHLQLLTVMPKALQTGMPCKRVLALQKGFQLLLCLCEPFHAVCFKKWCLPCMCDNAAKEWVQKLEKVIGRTNKKPFW